MLTDCIKITVFINILCNIWMNTNLSSLFLNLRLHLTSEMFVVWSTHTHNLLWSLGFFQSIHLAEGKSQHRHEANGVFFLFDVKDGRGKRCEVYFRAEGWRRESRWPVALVFLALQLFQTFAFITYI